MKLTKQILAIGIIAIACNIAFADIQKGYVRTIKRPGKKVEYISGVQIYVKGIPGSFRSKSKGEFELELRPLKLAAGASFSLRNVYKPGYELYDQNLSRVYSPKSPVEVILRDVRQEAKDQQTFAQNMFKGSEANYKKKISALEKQLAEGKITKDKYREQLQKYQDLFDKYQSQIDIISKRYAGLDYMYIDPTTEAINVAFSNGDYELADSLLNSLGSIDAKATAILDARKDIEKKIEFGQSVVAEGESEKAQNLKDAERLAELMYAKHLSFLNEFQNDSAAYYLKRRAELVPENIAFNLEAGVFIDNYLSYHDLALKYYFTSLSLAKQQYVDNENHSDIATCYNNIGGVYNSLGDYIRALEYLEKALKIQLELFDETHPDVAMCFNNIGLVYNNQGDYSMALEYYGKALRIQQNIFGKNHPDVARSYNNIGLAYTNLDECPLALEYLKTALKIRQEILGDNHPDVATCYNNIGLVYDIMHDYPLALEYYERALRIQQIIFGENHPNTAASYHNIGCVFNSQQDYTLGSEYLTKAMEVWLGIFGDTHPNIATCYDNIGWMYNRMGYYPLALEHHEKALKLWRQICGESHPNVATCYYNIGFTYYRQLDYPLALEYYKKALKVRLEIFDVNHPKLITLYGDIFNTYHKIQLQDPYKRDDFNKFMADKALIGTIVGIDTPAAKIGLSGEYIIIEFGEWDFNNNLNLYDVNEELRGKPKDIVLYKDGVITKYHFENQIGMGFNIKVIGEKEKKLAEEAYKNWVAKGN